MQPTRRGYAVIFGFAGIVGFFAQELGIIGWWL